MARKPLSEKTVAENCLKWGTGGINIDESRVETEDNTSRKVNTAGHFSSEEIEQRVNGGSELGRFPANLILDNSEEVRECFPNESERFFKSILYYPKASKSERNKGCEELEEKQMDTDGEGRNQAGFNSADRKPMLPRANNHPTVKPIALMEYLIKMVTKE
jgi:site-specific DNA-methyltransferase (adenine-specific)